MEKDTTKILEEINENIIELNKKSSWWKSLLHGVMSGFGSIVGIIIGLAILGWVLNIIGLIPWLSGEVNQWRSEVQQVKETKLPTN